MFGGRNLKIAVLVALFATWTSVVSAQDDPPRPASHAGEATSAALSDAGEACDRLAGNPRDPDGPKTGVAFGAIDLPRAVAECSAARLRHPSVARFTTQLARAYYRGRQFDLARALLPRAAEAGHAEAMILLAEMVQLGAGDEPNVEVANRTIRKAAEAGSVAGQTRLSFMLRYGLGTPRDPKAAFEMARIAAEAGYAPAMRTLASQLKDGDGVEKNEVEAANWFRNSLDIERALAEAGDAVAMGVLGQAYLNGEGVDRNDAEAFRWHERALANGNFISNHSLGWMYFNGRGNPKDSKKGCDYYEVGAVYGSPVTVNNFAGCFRYGQGREKDVARAVSMYEAAALRGDRFSPRNLGKMFEAGENGKVDLEAAAKLFQLAAERGLADGMLDYGWALTHGRGVAKDETAGCDWYEKAAALAQATAMNNLAHCFKAGRGRGQDVSRATDLFIKAAYLGSADALYTLAQKFGDGDGVPVDPNRARDFLRRAAEAGHKDAMLEYGLQLSLGTEGDPNSKAGCPWLAKAAERGADKALFALALCHLDEEWPDRNIDQAIALLEKSGRNGEAVAYRMLGIVFGAGQSVKADPVAATQYFKKGADLDDSVSMSEYGRRVFQGIGVGADPAAGCEWLRKAAEKDEPSGHNDYGFCLEHGFGRAKNTKAARSHFAKAAELGNGKGMRNVARALDAGLGGPRDTEAAAQWLRKALVSDDDAMATDLIALPTLWQKGTITQLQRILKDEGLYAGAVDGVAGPAFDEAIWKLVSSDETKKRLRQEIVLVPTAGTKKGMFVRVCGGDGSATKKPLILINHGLSTDPGTRKQLRADACGASAEFFVSKGYLVAYPVRRGYGDTGGEFAEGGPQVCSKTMDFVPAGMSIASDIEAVLRHLLATRNDIEANSTVVLGHSGGGWGTLGLASRNPSEIQAFINFSGGHGSQRGKPDGNCGPGPLERGVATFGKTSRKPMLWVYVENDSHIGPRLARIMHKAFTTAGGMAQFVMLPAYETEGHDVFTELGIEHWGPPISQFLETLKRPR